MMNEENNIPFKAQISQKSLHDPYDLHHIHGMRKRLFRSFNEYSNILNNALMPPVLKTTRKVKIKIKDSDIQTLNNNYIHDLNLLLTEIKKESKNENLHIKKDKSSVMLKKLFQMKLIQCYKLAIDAIQVCSKTLEAGTYNPIQSKMKNLIQIISTLSLITGKYLYGESFKKKKEESYDLVQKCKVLEIMLDECGYKETDNESDINMQHRNKLDELANIALIKSKTKSCSTISKQLDMYKPTKAKLGSIYAQKWLKKSLEFSKNMDMGDNCSYNRQIIYEQPISLNKDQTLYSYDTKIKLDDIKTVIEDYYCEEEIDNNYKQTKNKSPFCTHEVTNFPAAKKTLKSNNNVGLFIMKENIWRNFPIKNLSLSQNGSLRLNILPAMMKDMKDIYSYRSQFKQQSTVHGFEVDAIFNVTESIIDQLIEEVLSKIDYNAIIYELLRQEFLE